MRQLQQENVERLSVVALTLDEMETLNLVAMSDAAFGDPSQLG